MTGEQGPPQFLALDVAAMAWGAGQRGEIAGPCGGRSKALGPGPRLLEARVWACFPSASGQGSSVLLKFPKVWKQWETDFKNGFLQRSTVVTSQERPRLTQGRTVDF